MIKAGSRKSCYLAIAIGLLSPTAAPAAKMIAVYNGTISQGADKAKLFGSGDITSAAATFTFVYDLGRANRLSLDGRSIFWGDNALSPIIAASIEIDGVSRDLLVHPQTTNTRGSVEHSSTPSFDMVEHALASFVDDGNGVIVNHMQANVRSTAQGLVAAGVSTTDYARRASDYSFAYFNIGQTDRYGTYAYQSWGYLDVSRVSVASGAVPEPATWAMLVMGFGLIGARARDRRNQWRALQT